MATFVTLVLALTLTLVAADDCKCSDDKTSKELEEIWTFLGLEQPEYPVVPGELSPAVPCSNCIENFRKKRRIEEERSREERSPQYFRAWRHANNARNKCPIGYQRFYITCVKTAQ